MSDSDAELLGPPPTPHIDSFLRAIVVAFLIGGFIVLTASAGHCKPKPRVELAPMPRLAIYNPAGAGVALELKIYDADATLWCPRVIWEFPNGTKATEESDCDAFEDTTERDREFQNWTKYLRLGAGHWEFRVRLEKAGKTVKLLSTTIDVIGGDQ